MFLFFPFSPVPHDPELVPSPVVGPIIVTVKVWRRSKQIVKTLAENATKLLFMSINLHRLCSRGRHLLMINAVVVLLKSLENMVVKIMQ